MSNWYLIAGLAAVFVGVHGGRFVDQHDGNVVSDVVAAL